jgi:iron(III) transport system substrate-binding protein
MCAVAVVLAVVGAGGEGIDAAADSGPGNVLTVYARDQEISEPLFRLFEQRTGIKVRARVGDPVDLADQIVADGAGTPADVYFGPVGDALGTLSAAGRLASLSERQLARVPPAYRSPDGTWVGTSGRPHVVFYNADELGADDLPDSILGFADPTWRGRIGWDPTSRSLRDIVTELLLVRGEDAARLWLHGIQANRPAAFQGTNPILTAVSAGEIVDVGFGSYSYLPNLQADGHAANVAAKFYVGGALGGLLNMAGVGIIKGTRKPAAAGAFVDFMLSPEAGEYYARNAFEIPVVEGAVPPAGTPTPAELAVPGLDVRRFDRLDAARRLLRQAGVTG